MENLNVIEFHRTRDFSSKMNITFEFIRQNFKPLIKSLLFIAGPPVLLASFFISSFYSKIFNLGQMAQNNPGSISDLEETFGTPYFFLEIGGAMVFAILASVITVSVVNNYIREYEDKKTNKIEVNDIWNRVRTTFPQYLGTMFMYMVLLIIGYFVALVPIFLFSTISPVIGGLITFVAFLAFFYCVITLSLLFPVRSNEDISFFDAIGRCFYLIRDKWWSTFGLLFVNWIIAYIMSLVFLIPWYITTFITMLHSVDPGSIIEAPTSSLTLMMNIFFMLYFLSGILLQTLPLTAISFQYFNLVERREAKGLLSRIDTLGQQTPPNPQDEQY